LTFKAVRPKVADSFHQLGGLEKYFKLLQMVWYSMHRKELVDYYCSCFLNPLS